MLDALARLGALVALLFMSASFLIGVYVILAYGWSIIRLYARGVCP